MESRSRTRAEGLLNTRVTEDRPFVRESVARKIVMRRPVVRRFVMGRSVVRTAEEGRTTMERRVSVVAMGMITMGVVRPPPRRMGMIPVGTVSMGMLPPWGKRGRMVTMRVVSMMTPAMSHDGPQWTRKASNFPKNPLEGAPETPALGRRNPFNIALIRQQSISPAVRRRQAEDALFEFDPAKQLRLHVAKKHEILKVIPEVTYESLGVMRQSMTYCWRGQLLHLRDVKRSDLLEPDSKFDTLESSGYRVQREQEFLFVAVAHGPPEAMRLDTLAKAYIAFTALGERRTPNSHIRVSAGIVGFEDVDPERLVCVSAGKNN